MHRRHRSLFFPAVLITLAGLAGCKSPGEKVRSETEALSSDEARRLSRGVKLAEQAYREKDPIESFEKYRASVEAYSEFPAAWNNLGVLLMEQDNHLSAAEAFATAADLSPTDPRPLYNLGLCWDRRNYPEDARRYYLRALERDANFLPALRGAIRAESLLNIESRDTLNLIERALAVESEEQWQKWMKLQRIRIENLPSMKLDAQP